MRLIGYRTPAGIRVAALAGDGRATDVAGVEDFYAAPSGWLAEAAELPADLIVDGLELAPPIRPAARILCVGLNYRAHAAEGGFDLPEHPAVFARWTPSLTVGCTQRGRAGGTNWACSWEGVVAVVIGAPLSEARADEARRCRVRRARRHDGQRGSTAASQWTVGNKGDRSGLPSPIVTADEVPADPPGATAGYPG